MQTQEQPQRSKEEKEISRNAITAIVIIFSFIGIFIYAISGVSEDVNQAEKTKKAKSDEAYFFSRWLFYMFKLSPTHKCKISCLKTEWLGDLQYELL
ncbi:MAG: hypothetical protein NTW78_01960 [Campylobacterales bacterium]|nr:hypothetical protein [Campylobacterales bacterium]